VSCGWVNLWRCGEVVEVASLFHPTARLGPERSDRRRPLFPHRFGGLPLRVGRGGGRSGGGGGHVALQGLEPGLRQGDDVLAGRLRSEMNVRICLEQHHVIRVLDEENEDIRVFAAQMQVHDAPIGEQGILIPIDAKPIESLRHAVAALDAFDDFVERRAKLRDFPDASEVLELDDVNRLGLGLDSP